MTVAAQVTSYLMMGALSPGLKRHSVTLFEGARSFAVSPGNTHAHCAAQ